MPGGFGPAFHLLARDHAPSRLPQNTASCDRHAPACASPNPYFHRLANDRRRLGLVFSTPRFGIERNFEAPAIPEPPSPRIAVFGVAANVGFGPSSAARIVASGHEPALRCQFARSTLPLTPHIFRHRIEFQLLPEPTWGSRFHVNQCAWVVAV
jgi:hypothetical protein